MCFLPVQPREKEPLGGTQNTWMSVLGTCSGILQLYQFILFNSFLKKEVAFASRMPLWPEGWGGLWGVTCLPPQGMGGQHGYFGLWIDVDFGKGHSKAKPTCTTYGSPQLSAQEDFQFQKLEVWAVGDAPKAEPVSVGVLLPSRLDPLHTFHTSTWRWFSPDLFPAAVAGQRNARGCTAGQESCLGSVGGLLKEPPQGGGVPDGWRLLCKLRRVWGPFRIQGSTMSCWPPCTASPPSDGLPGWGGGHTGGRARAPVLHISLVASVGPQVRSEKRVSGRTPPAGFGH